MTQQAACAQCETCLAVIIIPALSDQAKTFRREAGRLEIMCPACRNLFSIPLLRIEHRDVTDDQLRRGFIEDL